MPAGIGFGLMSMPIFFRSAWMASVDIYDRTLGDKDVAVADAYADLARVYARGERWTDAEAAQRTAMRVYENALGRDHPVIAGAIAGICENHLHTGRLAEAEAECRDALAIRERTQGPNNYGMLGPLILLGDIRVQRGELAAADSLYSAGLAIIQERIGAGPRGYELLYPRIAALRDLQHRPAEAAELRRRVGGKPVRSLGF